MKSTLLKNKRRLRRRNSVRAGLRKNPDLLRLSVSRSLKHITAQIIDDSKGRTVASATTKSKSLAGELEGKNKTERAKVVGTEIARMAKEAGVGDVVFDRGHCKFHGRVKALAEAAREGGLKF